MSHRIGTIVAIAAAGALAGCVSTAEGILDGVAGTIADAGSNVLFNVDEEACRVDPYWLAKKGVELEFYGEKSFTLANTKCQDEFGVSLDKSSFEADYAALAKPYCTGRNGAPVQSTYCTQTLQDIAGTPAPEPAAFTPNKEKMRDYQVGEFDCDHKMFTRKMNVARLAQIEATSYCADDGGCYEAENMVDRNRPNSFGSDSSWSNAPGTSRTVKFTWETPATDVEQIYFETPEGFPLGVYTLEIATPTGQQVQVARVSTGETRKACHRFNPIDVKSITLSGGLIPSLGDDRILINEFVVR